MSDLTERVRRIAYIVKPSGDGLVIDALCDEADRLAMENAALTIRVEELSRMVDAGLEVSSSRVTGDTHE